MAPPSMAGSSVLVSLCVYGSVFAGRGFSQWHNLPVREVISGGDRVSWGFPVVIEGSTRFVWVRPGVLSVIGTA